MASKEWIEEGNVWRVGDNVNIESIYTTGEGHGGNKLDYVAIRIFPDFPKKMKKGDSLSLIIICMMFTK